MKEKCKVNQLVVGNKKDQQNNGSNNPRTSRTARAKSNSQHFRASNKNHSALRTRKRQ